MSEIGIIRLHAIKLEISEKGKLEPPYILKFRSTPLENPETESLQLPEAGRESTVARLRNGQGFPFGVRKMCRN